MMLTDWRRERTIRIVLKTLARQRVLGIPGPNGPWLVERALPEGEKIESALRTCHLRGWAEPISPDGIPHLQLTNESELPRDVTPSHVGPVYRLTDSGWQAIHRTHSWVIATLAIAFASLVASLIGSAIAVALAR